MASGIAHDINNALTPASLYTETLLEDPGLSENHRRILGIVCRAIEDVSQTIARMREFYREREPQLSLSRIDLNVTVQQALQLTHARWSDLPQQKGVMIEVRTDLAAQHNGCSVAVLSTVMNSLRLQSVSRYQLALSPTSFFR